MPANKKLEVKAEESGMRLDIFLSRKLKITRSQAQKLIEGGQISFNSAMPKKTGEQVRETDEIFFNPSAAKFSKKTQLHPSREISLEPKFSFKDIKIISETPEYFVIEKPSGMITHSTIRNEKDSLAALMAKEFPKLKKVGDDPERPGIVHRLDKEASGLLVIARTQKMFEFLKNQFKNRTIEKEYLVLVHGPTPKDIDSINFRIERSADGNRMAAKPFTDKGLFSDAGKDAVTDFVAEKRFINFTLLRVKIHTGRMHQIRAHMFAYDHPVVGDPLYFQKKRKRRYDEECGRLFLHCTKLGFTDINGEQKHFESPLPAELVLYLTKVK